MLRIAELDGVAAALRLPDPAGLFAVGGEVGDDGLAQIDGGGGSRGIKCDADDGGMGGNARRSDDGALGGEEKGGGIQLARKSRGEPDGLGAGIVEGKGEEFVVARGSIFRSLCREDDLVAVGAPGRAAYGGRHSVELDELVGEWRRPLAKRRRQAPGQKPDSAAQW